MERKSTSWHILVLALLVAVLNEGIHFLLDRFVFKGNVPFWCDVILFVLIVGITATIYIKVYLKHKYDEE